MKFLCLAYGKEADGSRCQKRGGRSSCARMTSRDNAAHRLRPR
jgi:hypothetical protein